MHDLTGSYQNSSFCISKWDNPKIWYRAEQLRIGSLREPGESGTNVQSFSLSVIVLLTAMVAGCETASLQNLGGARILTSAEMDRITAGLATAKSEATALATGGAPRTAVSTITQTNSGNSPIPGTPFRSYAATRATALASNGQRVRAGVSAQISVDGANGGAWIDAAAVGAAAGNGTGPAQASTQAYGISTSRTDLAFGSVSASACCGSTATVQVKTDSGAGGPYSQEIRSTATSDVQGQAQRRVDTAVVSSALPILDPAQLSVTGGPARISPKY